MSKMTPMIYVKGVHVNFPLHLDNSRSFRRAIATMSGIGKKTERQYKAALSSISLKVHKGERIALLGSNGSGKTTLLRTLSGVYEPPQGVIVRRGSVATMINNTMGMDFYSSGLENIYLRGMRLGFTRSEMNKHVDDIIDFTELGDDIYRPVRTYSSGMLARLSFGIATSFMADIYLMDEWIGAGDARFFERAQERIDKLFTEDSILVLASHSDALLRQWCTKGVVLDQGSISLKADIESCIIRKNELMKKPRV
jgi:ABC-type polysaccharide/polyol phosphate transport system ATPase subunit